MVYKGSPTSDGRSWYFRCYKKDKFGNNKQFKSKKYKTKHEAEEAESYYMIDKLDPNKINFHIVSLKYFEDMNTYNRNSTYQSYYYNYQLYIKPFFERYYINKINTKDIQLWREWINEKDLSVSYKNKIYSVLLSIFKFAMRYNNLESNPVQIVGRFKDVDKVKEEEIKYITFEEFKQFISVVDEPLWYAFFSTLYYTGCRKGELFALQWKDIDFNTNTLSISKTVARSLENNVEINPTKTNINRKVKMNKTLVEILQNYKNKKKKEFDDFNDNWYVFGGTIPIARTTVDRYKHKYFELSGVHEITIHQFRHSAVTLLVNKMLEQDTNIDVNKALITLSKRFGHSPEVMLKTYAHLWEDKLQEPIVDILDNL